MVVMQVSLGGAGKSFCQIRILLELVWTGVSSCKVGCADFSIHAHVSNFVVLSCVIGASFRLAVNYLALSGSIVECSYLYSCPPASPPSPKRKSAQALYLTIEKRSDKAQQRKHYSTLQVTYEAAVPLDAVLAVSCLP